MFGRSKKSQDQEFFSEFDDVEQEKKPTTTRTKIIRFAVVFIVLLSLLIGGIVLYNRDPTPKVQEKPTVTVELINAQQVAWADTVCTSLATWSDSMVSFPDDEDMSPQRMRRELSKLMQRNATQMRAHAKEITALPEQAHEQALTEQETVTILDNRATVDEDLDDSTIESSEQMARALTDYASSLNDASADLNKIATYDSQGLRTSLFRITGMFPQLNEQYASDVATAFPDDLFDNVATMIAVSQLENCNSALIDYEELTQEYGEEVKQQESADIRATLQRCEALKKSSEDVDSVSSVVEENIGLCDEFIQENPVNKSDPIYDVNLDTQDDKRASWDHGQGIDDMDSKYSPNGETDSATEDSSLESSE